MSAHASARDHQVATELGAVEILIKPFTHTELLRSIRRAIDCETGYQGSIHGLSLIDMAQMFHLAQRSVTIHITVPGEPTSKIHFRRGEIVGASHRELQGPPALRAILAAPSGNLHTTGLEDGVHHSIHATFDHLLLDSLSQLDEAVHEGRPVDEGPSIFELGEFDDSPEDDRTSLRGLDLHALLAPAAEPVAPRRSPALNAACRDLTEAVEGAVVCAILTIKDGAVLGYHVHRPGAGAPNETVIAAAARELFAGSVNRLTDGRLHEIQLTATHHYIFAKLLRDHERALVLVTDKTISVGLGWALLRAQLGALERLAP